jgi:Uma2 family endonuclease
MKAVGMAATAFLKRWISPEEYLRGELTSDVRHEYFAGEVVAMAGASENHNYIAGNFFGELYLHLRGKKCAPFMNDMKAHIQRQNDDWFYYPDVMVNCDPAGQHPYFCETPSLIVEVLSPETEMKDRREKRLAYERIDALKTYVLVSQERREIFIFRRSDRGWDREVLPDDGETLRVPDLDFSITLDAIYARTGL